MINSTNLESSAIATELREKLIAIFAEVFLIEIDGATEDLKREEIDTWDSVSHLRLVSEIEEIFEIALSDEEVTGFASLREIERLLKSRGVGSDSLE